MSCMYSANNLFTQHLNNYHHQQEDYESNDDVFNGETHLGNTRIFNNLSQFLGNFIVNYSKLLLLKFPKGMILYKKCLFSTMLISVLLINCGYVNARPNLESNQLDSSDKTNVRMNLCPTSINYFKPKLPPN